MIKTVQLIKLSQITFKTLTIQISFKLLINKDLIALKMLNNSKYLVNQVI